MIILGIESSCDETSCAIVKNGKVILSNVISSQINLHETYGGVVPELASRRHLDAFIPVLDQTLKLAGISLSEIDAIAVARGPGLIGSLLIGLNSAKTLSLLLQKPLIGINHIEAHIYAPLMEDGTEIDFPAIGVILSGGHSTLLYIRSLGEYELIGETVDDAIGEAFDKTARILNLPYPGGPLIEELSLRGDPFAFPFKAGKVKEKPFHFSFSGLKTAVLYAVKKMGPLSESEKQNIAASFQYAAFKDIVEKTAAAAKIYKCRSVLLGGGVTNNRALRRFFSEKAPLLTCHWPAKGLSLDNAAMIAGLGFVKYQKFGADPIEITAETTISF